MSSRPARWFVRSLVCTLGVAALACTSKGAPKPEVVAEPVPVPMLPPPEPVPVLAEPEAPAPKTRHQQRPATIAAADEHACALVGAGAVACWGRGDDGQLAPGTDKHHGAITSADATPASVSTTAITIHSGAALLPRGGGGGGPAGKKPKPGGGDEG